MKRPSSAPHSIRGAIAASTLSLALIGPSAASAYEIETTIGATEGPSDDSPTYSLGVEYFFTPLTHGSGAPRQELPFLERVASLKATATDQRDTWYYSDSSNGSGPTTRNYEQRTRTKFRGFDVEYVFREPGNAHAITVGGSIYKAKGRGQFLESIYSHGELIEENEGTFEHESDAQALYVGYDYYLGQNWTVGGEVAYTHAESDQYEFDQTTATLRTERLWQLPKGQWVGLKAEAEHLWVEGLKRWDFKATGKFYFNERTGIYLSGEKLDLFNERTIEAGISHYFTDAIFARLFGSTSRFDDIDDGHFTESGWGIVFGIRL